MVKRLSWLNLPLWKKKNPRRRGLMVWFWWQMGCAGVVWGSSRPLVSVFLFPLCDSRGACLGGHPYRLLPLHATCWTLFQLSQPWLVSVPLPHVVAAFGEGEIVLLGTKNCTPGPDVPGCSFRSVTFEPPIWEWSCCVFSAQLSCRNVLEGSEMWRDPQVIQCQGLLIASLWWARPKWTPFCSSHGIRYLCRNHACGWCEWYYNKQHWNLQLCTQDIIHPLFYTMHITARCSYLSTVDIYAYK